MWAQKWPKIIGVFGHITPICKDLKQIMDKRQQNMISISFLTNDHKNIMKDLNRLNASFMYNQTIKEILLSIHYEERYFNDFIAYCSRFFGNNPIEIQNLSQFEQEYHQHPPIWWYTHPGFLSSMMNQPSHMMKLNLVIRMGFFIRDLHNNIAQVHAHQQAVYKTMGSFTVYRGQDFSQAEFDELAKMKGGFLSFNNFLLTDKNQQASLNFIQDSIQTSHGVGVLFIIKVDPTTPSTPFANISDISYIKQDEILFSMNPIFRIGQIKPINNNRLWEVNLTFTSYSDSELHRLTEQIQKEAYPHLKGWDRLGMLLIKFEQFNKAQELYDILIDQAKTDSEKADVYHMLGWVKDGQGKYANALDYYQQSIEIKQNILSPIIANLASSYENAGTVHEKMSDYSTALSSHLKALKIRLKNLPSNHPDLANSYEHVGLMYGQMGNYTAALLSHEKALDIYKKIHSSNHPDLAICYNNIGLVYDQMGNYSDALSAHQKALEIYTTSLPSNHPHLATSYNNIGLVYNKTGNFSEAFAAHEKALEIRKSTLHSKHPDLAISFNNIGMLYVRKGEFYKALQLYQRALEIAQSSLPPNHHDTQLYQKNIELMKKKL
ncbi:unnamed protein product [Rotaria magnacalcarata]|uniref:Tetratricopeptide repeat protein n=1 Tax=Rotaria magnacalcarata TaxID=392030 RepID=A0A819BT04_9BILA|nr:unnamed protein product [Rotaria magnacalcarata]CAF3806369.1 unnamed protein product [Rotaria magnacalcarata]